MMQKNKKNSEERLFENIIPNDFEFGFLVETNFRTSLLAEYYNSKNQNYAPDADEAGVNSADKKRRRFEKFALRIAEDSLFTNTYNYGMVDNSTAESSTNVGNSASEFSHIKLLAPNDT